MVHKMLTYNYEVEVKKDLENYIDENYDFDSDFDGMDIEDIYDKIYEDVWVADSVTGNASGSYTFCRYQAEENLLHNMDLVYKACVQDFGYDASDIGKLYIEEQFETIDVMVRCYFVGTILWDVLNERLV